ncbi:MAG: phage gp6-like head-tail connector protein [Oribacterium sp.]|nr:phage gp6-like head-tail connector protein [Oribacterium sp.]
MTKAERMALVAEKLPDICSYLRTDLGDDDEQVTNCATAALDYIVGAVGTYDSESSKAYMLLCAITQDLYDHRELTQSEQQLKLRQSYTYQTIILQLKLEYELSQEEGS